ncbi:hypothetical protein KY307_03425 [Candidatus Woesearchaeota archaeon]|nr:hypothetical protein [Candidatus Woesearchaeota archaeon]
MRKGALSLSVTAIVIIVIAFVVLGLGLTLTKTIFKGAMKKIPEAIALTELEAEPTAEKPIVFPDTIDIKRNKMETLKVGVYNRRTATLTNATLNITECIDSNGNQVSDIPTLTAIAQEISPGEAKAYKAIIKENGLKPGRYICKLVVNAVLGEGTEAQEIESKQFFLQVTS